MKVLVLGATGGTGRLIVRDALAKGHSIVALVRSNARAPNLPGANVVDGDARDEAALLRALDGCNAFVSSLGTGMSPFFREVTLLSIATGALVAAMTQSGVRRLVCITGLGLATLLVSAGPQVLPKWNPNAGGIAAVYFRDPEGHPLELLRFPAGKGAAQWHKAASLFLGIDHTALAVADPPASTRFCQGLGFAVRGHSNNYGIEQERLSGVRAAHVQITALRFDRAPGVEFLHYVGSGATQPRENARPFDLIATRTVVIEPSAAAMCKRSGAVLRSTDGCLLRDPDGHFVEIRSSDPEPPYAASRS